MIGATIIDTVLDRRGVILSADPKTLDVSVQWRPGQVVTLRVADIVSRRYQVIEVARTKG